MFRARVKQLQDSHAKFRSQIKALENVKDLTISLQSQLSIMEQENQQLAKENAELTDLNRQAAQLIEEKQSSEKQLQERAHEADLRCENIQGRYNELAESLSDLEDLAADEQAMRLAAESRMNSMDEAAEALRVENRSLHATDDMSKLRISQCDQVQRLMMIMMRTHQY